MRFTACLAVLGMLLIPAGPAWGEAAKVTFGTKTAPAVGAARAVGTYASGCLAGAVQLPETGPGWQVMRLSRNRNWGHPSVIAFIERLSAQVQQIGWAGLYVGDISQPRGGPMRSGHRSHQIGLDVDIWLRAPERLTLTRSERERIASHVVTNPGQTGLNGHWTPGHGAVLKAAAQDAGVARIFVNPAIKHALCRSEAAHDDRAWLRKVRPWYGHNAHFHVRLHCPPSSPGCVAQAPIPPGDGCGNDLAWWFSDAARNPKPTGKRRTALTMADLPAPCGTILHQ